MLRALDTVEDDMEAYKGLFRRRFREVHHTSKDTYVHHLAKIDLVVRPPLLELKINTMHDGSWRRSRSRKTG